MHPAGKRGSVSGLKRTNSAKVGNSNVIIMWGKRVGQTRNAEGDRTYRRACLSIRREKESKVVPGRKPGI